MEGHPRGHALCFCLLDGCPRGHCYSVLILDIGVIDSSASPPVSGNVQETGKWASGAKKT